MTDTTEHTPHAAPDVDNLARRLTPDEVQALIAANAHARTLHGMAPGDVAKIAGKLIRRWPGGYEVGGNKGRRPIAPLVTLREALASL